MLDTENAREHTPAVTTNKAEDSAPRTFADEVEQIWNLLLKDAQQRRGKKGHAASKRPAPVLVLGLTLLALGLFWIGFAVSLRLLIYVAVGLVLLSIVAAFFWMLATSWRDWQRRGQYAVQTAKDSDERAAALVEQLMPFSRAALEHVAAGTQAPARRVERRVALFLGATRAGGIIGLLALFLAGLAAVARLPGPITIPFFELALTPKLLLGVLFTAVIMGGGVLLGAHSMTALSHYQEVLLRIASTKKTIAEEAKEYREREKFARETGAAEKLS